MKGYNKMESLATKYRPNKFDDVVEQNVIKGTLLNQLSKGEIKNAYLFCGGAGTGKTTSARLFANAINDGKGITVELDAASHGKVDDIRKLIEDSRFKPIGYKYKVFLLDEVHAITDQGWQALLLTLEEPTPTSVFIFCTTDPQKIPKTILSRVQRYNFQRISRSGITERLKYIISKENEEGMEYTYEDEAIDYIAKLADGGMRDAITLMDKVLGYSKNLTVEAVTESLGTVGYETMFDLTDALCKMDKKSVIEIVETIHGSGHDLKQFIKEYNNFVLDLCKYDVIRTFDYLQIPVTYKKRVSAYTRDDFAFFTQLLNEVINLNSSIKWDTNPKPLIESTFILLCSEV